MSDFEIEFQNEIPIVTLNSNCRYLPDEKGIKKILDNNSNDNLGKMILDLSNCSRLDGDFFNNLREFHYIFINSSKYNEKRLGIVIPNAVNISGLKIKLIADSFEVYSSKYDAVYNLVNKTIQ
jgi:hypothetical protein